MSIKPVHIIGGGLAGSEASWQAAQAGVPVILHEMRPVRGTEAHKTGGLAELVCSNSFRSDDAETNAVGLLHAEMRLAGSLIMQAGDAHQVPAGGALAVDRDGFSQAVTAKLESHPLITIVREEMTSLPPDEWDQAIVATGPLTAPDLAAAIAARTGADALAFFDAIAPIVHFDTIDMNVAWFQSRYDKVGPGGTGKDYINCPMDKPQYDAFIEALLTGDKTEFREWEGTPYFDGCLPIEIMAERGPETLRHGPMKPMGLTNAHNPAVKPYAVVQLRQDNALGTLYNMVGFQTKLKYAEQSASSAPFRGWRMPILHGWADCTATPTSIRRNCWMARCSSGRAPDFALPARSPAARVMSKAPPSAFLPDGSPPPRVSAARFPRRRSPLPLARCSTTSPAAISFRTMNPENAPSSR